MLLNARCPILARSLRKGGVSSDSPFWDFGVRRSDTLKKNLNDRFITPPVAKSATNGHLRVSRVYSAGWWATRRLHPRLAPQERARTWGTRPPTDVSQKSARHGAPSASVLPERSLYVSSEGRVIRHLTNHLDKPTVKVSETVPPLFQILN